mmetsp:Transcript_8223/g.10758  ORF Transcript_8223/g.10758 Transcript_8223/m.10758 type:complete len:81 (-) Transcript_8223:15-257(-)
MEIMVENEFVVAAELCVLLLLPLFPIQLYLVFLSSNKNLKAFLKLPAITTTTTSLAKKGQELSWLSSKVGRLSLTLVFVC